MKLKLERDKPTVNKTIVVYSGRFQPFHKGHYISYQKLVSKFGKNNVYVATSNVTDTTKSPFTFEEKKKIATKLFGIPSDKFIQIKNPYAPKEILDKYDGTTTQYIAAVGEKDATRLTGKYFKPYNGKAGYGYDEIGYTYAVPAEQNPISGTDVRANFKGADDKKGMDFFKKIYPKFDDEIYQMVKNKLNEVGTGFPTGMAGSFDKINVIDDEEMNTEGFPGGVGTGLVLPGGYINGAPTGSTNESANTEPSFELRPEPTPTRHQIEHPSEEEDAFDGNSAPYDPIAEIINRAITEDDFEQFISEYLNQEADNAPTNPIYDKELTYTAKDGQKKKIKVRSALRLPKDHEAHIQAKKLTKRIIEPVKAEPKKQETPPQKGQPVQKGQTQQGKVDANPMGGGSGDTQETPPPQTLKGVELKSSAEHSKDKEKVKDGLMDMVKGLDKEDREFISKGNHKPGSEARKSMSGNIASGLKKFGNGIKNWAGNKKEMIKGTGEAVWALANGKKLGSSKNKQTGKWEYSDEKRKEQTHHLKEFAKDTALILGSMALGGAGVAAVQAALGGATAGGVASAAGSGAIGVFSHGIGGFGGHLAKDIAKHATLETLGFGATRAAAGGAGLATASMGLFEVANGNDFVSNVMQKVAKRMETYELSDVQLKQAVVDYKKEKEKGDLGSLFGTMNENLSPSKSKNIQHFIEYATKRLKLNEKPNVVLLKDNELGGEQPSLGGYSPLTGEIFVVTDGRLTADILRTIAHEMIHRKQDELKLIRSEDDAGKTGSPIENQANSLAGVLLRDYAKLNNQIYTETINKEDISIDVDKGDTVLMGKFKNKKTTVKDIGKDDYGMPTINGKKATTFRIPKGEKRNPQSVFEAEVPSTSEDESDMIICDNCGHDWYKSEGGNAMYICHVCGHDNQPSNNPTQTDLDEKISQSNLDSIEKYADKELNPADIEFTNHFFDRVNDIRNGKDISEAELIGFFKRLAKHKKEFLEFLTKYDELVVKDSRSNINIPFVKMANKAIAKTIMRKDDFKSSTPKMVNEELKWEASTLEMCMNDMVPLTLPIVKQLVEIRRTNAFHITDIDNLSKLVSLEGKSKSISAFNKVDSAAGPASGKGMWTKGGILVLLSGIVLAESISDLWSKPDKSGIRWITPGNAIHNEFSKKNKIIDFAPQLKPLKEKWEQSKSDLTNQEKQYFIKTYIDTAYKLMIDNKQYFQNKYLNSDTLYYNSDWNEVILSKIKVEKIAVIQDHTEVTGVSPLKDYPKDVQKKYKELELNLNKKIADFYLERQNNPNDKSKEQIDAIKNKYKNVEIINSRDVPSFIKKNGGYIRESVNEAPYNHNNINVKDHPTIVPKKYIAKLPKGNLDGYIVKNGNNFMVAIIDRKNKLQISGGTTNSIKNAVLFLKKKGFDLQPLKDAGIMKPKTESVNEETASEIIKDLDKVRHDLIKKVDVLIAKKKKLYSNIDIESPMSAEEKQLDKDIQSIFSQIQQLIQQKRSLKKESVNEGFKSEYKGNDGIIWKKGKTQGGVTNFTPYYKGHNIDTGGHNFGNEKKLLKFIDDYIVSSQIYNKYRFESVNETLLLEGGAYGHMNHPFDISMNLTFGDLKKIINNALDGKLGVVKEKTDGQALAISWKNGRLISARNKGHLANSGANALDMNALASKFAGRGELSDAYNFAMKDLSAAISGLSEKERQSIFKDGSAFCNLEVIYPENANVIPYGQSLLVLHNVVDYDDGGNAIGSVDGAEGKLASMIKKINANVQSKYTIQGPPITKLPKDEKLSSQKGKFNGMLSALQSRFNLSDKNGIADYHYAWWMKFVNDSKKNLNQLEKEGLARRWAFDNKSFGIKSLTDEDAKKWADGVDKEAKDKIIKGNIRKFEDIFLGVGAEVLSFMSSVLTAQPDKALQSIKTSLDASISDIRSGGSEAQIKRLEKELARLDAIGGFDKLVPNEGLVFVYKDNVYKLTGTFAPLNQILGIFKFGR